MIRYTFVLFLSLVFFSCGSFDTNTNLEAEVRPSPREDGEDMEEYIRRSLKEMYPKIGVYKVLYKQKTAVATFLMGGNSYEVKFYETGSWKNSEVVIAYDFTMPEGVQRYMKNPDNKGWVAMERKLDEKPDALVYKIKFKRGNEIKTAWLERDGSVIREKIDLVEDVSIRK